jgi:hypothetical protein
MKAESLFKKDSRPSLQNVFLQITGKIINVKRTKAVAPVQPTHEMQQLA